MRLIRCDWRDCGREFVSLPYSEKNDGREKDWITYVEYNPDRDSRRRGGYDDEITLCPLHGEQFKNSVRKNY